MAFLKTAKGILVHRNFSPENWGNFIGQNRHKLAKGPHKTASNSPNLIAQASEILGESFDPKNYVLSHCTIVASVDVDEVPNIKTGSIMEDGRRVLRKYADYRITPDTEIFCNNNGDSWARETLLKSYRTFVGAHNFCEHLQREDLSKGRIIDAVARDIGPSVYVDILLATHRKHASLVRDIESGNMSTLSMGCSCVETTCTKCGNVAVDETELCAHIRYEKRNHFYDDKGQRRLVAELCGHPSLDPTAGITFIEASWVAVPAFQGAVMRNILEPSSVNFSTRSQMREVLSKPPTQWTEGARGKTARSLEVVFDETSLDATQLAEQRRQQRVAQFPPMPGGDDGGGGGGEEPPADPMKDLEDEVEKYLLNKIKKKIKDKMVSEKDEGSKEELAPSTNENINHQAAKKAALANGTATLLRIARSDVELLDGLARLKQSHGIKVSKDLYRTALRVGSTDEHPSLEKYLSRCAGVLGRKPQKSEAKTLIRLGQILALRKKTRF